MRRIGNLYARTLTPEALRHAFHMAARHKHGKRACFKFEKHLASNLDELHRELSDGSYSPRPYYTFVVHEPKRRTIYAPAFRDLVVQHAIYRVISPIFERVFIDQSFACRIGKGTHKAADYAQAALQASPIGSYTLKLDIRKFFYHIDRVILRGLVERKIKDARMVDLMMAFADHGEPVGIPIGNLLSQLYALIYLNPLDHFIKRELGIKRYCRYVDDFVLLSQDREELLRWKEEIKNFLADRLGLQLHPRRQKLQPISNGIDFLGYIVRHNYILIRRRVINNFRTKIKDVPCGFKAISSKVKKELLPQVKNEEWFFDSELVILAEKQGYKIKEIPVTWTEPRQKDNKSRVKILPIICSYFKEFINLKRRLK